MDFATVDFFLINREGVMKSKYNWRIGFGIILIVISFFVYFIHYLIFKDLHHIMIYLIGDIAFLFLEIFIVTLIIERFITEREKKIMLSKLNVVLGAFFGEIGIKFLDNFSCYVKDLKILKDKLKIKSDWDKDNFKITFKEIEDFKYELCLNRENFESIKKFLMLKREFLVQLMGNPNLIEHDRFTELLLSLFHLCEELESRENLQTIPDSDFEHIKNDFKRAYFNMIREWIYYVQHLQNTYPFLFSFFIRKNPFNEDISITVKQ